MDLSPLSPDKRLELAYDAAQEILRVQDSTLGNTRSRANSLLATGALLTSISAGIGLVNIDPDRGAVLPVAGAWSLLTIMVILGTLVLFVLWPIKVWHFGPDPSVIVDMRRKGASDDATREFVIEELIKGIAMNAETLTRRQTAFRWAAVALVVEVATLVATLAFLG